MVFVSENGRTLRQGWHLKGLVTPIIIAHSIVTAGPSFVL